MDEQLQATVDAWLVDASRALGVTVPSDYLPLLEIARLCAHEVARPTAPLTTYLAGLAAAQGLDPAEAARIIAALIDTRAENA